MRDKFLRGIAEQGFDLDGGAHGFLDSSIAGIDAGAANSGDEDEEEEEEEEVVGRMSMADFAILSRQDDSGEDEN